MIPTDFKGVVYINFVWNNKFAFKAVLFLPVHKEKSQMSCVWVWLCGSTKESRTFLINLLKYKYKPE